MIIGIDPHKASHTASALDPATNTTTASLRIDASLHGYRKLLTWSTQFDDRRWAVENAHGLGHHLSQWLIRKGETVLDIPCTATARLRELSRGGSRKTDLIDAAAAASVAAWIGDAVIVEAENYSTICSMLEERRSNVAQQRTRVANQLHVVLRELVAGGAPLKLTTVSASVLLCKVRPVSGVEQVRKQMARDLVKDLKTLDRNLARIEAQMKNTLAESGSRLETIDGVGPVIAVRLLGRVGHTSRFRSSDAFGAYVGTAPVEIASGERTRHRLSRSGDRRLNSTIHLIAVTQVRMPGSIGRAYFEKKIGEGKTRNEAMRCLKRRLANHIWRLMRADERSSSEASSVVADIAA